MEFLILLAAVVALILIWRNVARFFARKGHKAVVSHFAGAICGIFSFFAAFLLLVVIIMPQAFKTDGKEESPAAQEQKVEESRPKPPEQTVAQTRPEPPILKPKPDSFDREKAEDIITLAYLNHVPQAAKAPFVSCKHKSIESKHFILCYYDNSFKGGHKALWEVTSESGKLSFLALNGSALSDLDHLPFSDAHKHQNPLQFDISAILDRFDGKESKPITTNAADERKNLTNRELDLYCAYLHQKNQLSSRADKLFPNPASPEREKWIEPQIFALQKRYFTDNGFEHSQVMTKVLAAKARCPASK
jgi:hypothetical protein